MAAVAGKRLEPVKCGACDFSSKRITAVEAHIAEAHKKTAKQLYDELHKGPQLCKCGCGQETAWLNWKAGYSSMVRGHNANIYAVYSAEDAEKIAKTRGSNWRGRPSWSKGLTKETDERVRARGVATSVGRKAAFDTGKIAAWNDGLTKETDDRVAAQATQSRSDFASGSKIQWHAGLSEQTDARVKKKNDGLRRAYATGELTQWHKGLTKAADPRLDKAWKSRDPIKEYEHIRWSHSDIKSMLENNSWLKLYSIESYKNDRVPALFVKCVMCDYFEKVALVFARNDRCPKCCPTGSNGQHEIADFIDKFGVKCARNVKGIIGRQELDVYAPARKLAIEFNGLYWHNEAAGKGDSYHQNKSDKCAELGITLCHVFEDEWRDKRQIVQSMIEHRLGLSAHKISARQCSTCALSPAEKRAFFEANHIDGDTASAHAIGLKLGSELVAAISLRRPFHKKHRAATEVARVTTLLGSSVRGALGKLTREALAWAKREGHEKLVSYVDTRHGARGAESWTSAGWRVTSETPPRFWWTDCEKRFNRFKFKADPKRGLTEAQVAEAANVVKIYGCKNLVLEAVA